MVGSSYSPVFLLPALFFGGAAYKLWKYLEGDGGQTEYYGKIDVQTVDSLHAKVYSRDGGEEVIFGSANFTNSGMFSNLEVIGTRKGVEL